MRDKTKNCVIEYTREHNPPADILTQWMLYRKNLSLIQSSKIDGSPMPEACKIAVERVKSWSLNVRPRVKKILKL